MSPALSEFAMGRRSCLAFGGCGALRVNEVFLEYLEMLERKENLGLESLDPLV